MTFKKYYQIYQDKNEKLSFDFYNQKLIEQKLMYLFHSLKKN